MDKKIERQFECFLEVKRRKIVSKTSTFSVSGTTNVGSSASTVGGSVSRTSLPQESFRVV